jgi:hypothetical protein
MVVGATDGHAAGSGSRVTPCRIIAEAPIQTLRPTRIAAEVIPRRRGC